MSKRLSSIFTYPVKGCRGNEVASIEVGAQGPGLDRRFMVVDHTGRFISQREHPRLALIGVVATLRHLQLSFPGDKSCKFFLQTDRVVEVSIWKDTCLAFDQGNEVAAVLSEYLSLSCRLVFMGDEHRRLVNPKYAANNERVAFTDGYPFLLISEASLVDLNSRLASPIPMNRFRPNLVISGCAPYEEDTWKRIRIGQIEFQVAKSCTRCVVTTIDQGTLQKSKEPLKTLASYRKEGDGVIFGQNLIHLGQGVLYVDDDVTVLQ